MYFNKILTKQFLQEQLIIQCKKLSVVGEEQGCSKHTVIKYAKKHDIYTAAKDMQRGIRATTVSKRSKDLTGQIFGDLTVVSRGANDKFDKVRWNCKCKCGVYKLINAASLIRGLTKTCGECERVNFEGYKAISGIYFKRIRKGAKDRNLYFDIIIEDIYNLWIKQNKKCALSGVDIFFRTNQDTALQTASVDRIDNQKGYTIDNIQIIHKRLNRVKSVLNNIELVFWAHKIAGIHNNTVELDVSTLKWNNGERK